MKGLLGLLLSGEKANKQRLVVRFSYREMGYCTFWEPKKPRVISKAPVKSLKYEALPIIVSLSCPVDLQPLKPKSTKPHSWR